MITLLQLQYFLKLCETEHITQTAKELFISQTALSSMIIGLEKELGTKLFDREGRSIRLNAAGKTYRRFVSEAFTALENGKIALQDLHSTGQSSISLATASTLVWLPMLREFSRAYPNCFVRHSTLTLQKLHSALENMEIDYVISGLDDFSDEGLAHVVLRKDPVYLCTSREHPFASRKSISMQELKGLPFINLPPDHPWQDFSNKLFADAGFPCKIAFECDYSLRASLIEANLGVSLTSGPARDTDLLHPNCYIPITDDYAHRSAALFWNPRKYLSHSALSFKDFCSTYYNLSKESILPDESLPTEQLV